MTPAAKFWACKRGPIMAAEALEVLGGGGYVEECGMPRLCRELPVYSIWEGSGNVIRLDVLRALRGEPQAVDALASELGRSAAETSDWRGWRNMCWVRRAVRLRGRLCGASHAT